MENPKIRFKGFTKDWEQRKLGDVAQEFKSGNSLKADEIDITGDYPVYGGNGLRGYTSTYNHDGEYALIGRQGALCGNMNYSAGKAYFTEHAVVVKADENNDTSFLYYMLDTMNLGQYSDQSAQPGLAVNKLVKLGNSFPKKEEQQQIGTYFRSLDHLITLHQRKCEQTKKLKKYMLQKMFPQNGAKVPEIRFDGFTYDWEQRKLGELGSLKNGMNFSKEAMGHGFPFINLQNIFGNNVIDVNKLELADATEKQLLEYSLLKGDVLFVRSSVKLEGVGEAALVPETLENTTYSGFIIRFRDEYGLNNDFKKYIFGTQKVRNQIMAQATNSANKNISQGVLENLTFEVPSFDEQAKIGEHFSNLDHLITLHQRKCDELKKMKKYMLQNMFI